jgi:hypothetical protein
MVDKVFNAYSDHNFASKDIVRLHHILMAPGTPDEGRRRILSSLNCDRLLLPPDPRKVFSFGEREANRLALLGDAMPRAYVVGGLRVLKDEQAVEGALTLGTFDPWQAALTDELSARTCSVTDLRPERVQHEIKQLTYVRNGLEIDVESEAAGLLVVSDTYWPGWVATVNGKEAQIHKVNRAVRGIRVPAGRSDVRMSYRPASVRIGIAISLTTLVLLGILLVPYPVTRPRSDEDEG